MSNVTLDVMINGRAVRKYSHEGKTFIEGRKGSDYCLRVKNHLGSRVKVVLSVDGLNVLTGDKEWERGYVVDAYNTVTIPGWRIDRDSASKFYFSDLQEAYNQGNLSNVGVIGLLAYKEKAKLVPIPSVSSVVHQHYHWNNGYWSPAYPPNYRLFGGNGGDYSGATGFTGASGIAASLNNSNFTSTLASAQCSAESSRDFAASASGEEKTSGNLATGWGESTEFKTSSVALELESTACSHLQLYYDSYRGLKHRGIDVSAPPELPSAFPGLDDFGCPPPTGNEWKKNWPGPR